MSAAVQIRHKGILGAVLCQAFSVLPTTMANSSMRSEANNGGHNSNAAPQTETASHHFIVTPSNLVVLKLVDSSRQRRLKSAQTDDKHHSWDKTNVRVRVEDLNGDQLSDMLQVVIAMTTRTRSYTIHNVPPNRSFYDGAEPKSGSEESPKIAHNDEDREQRTDAAAIKRDGQPVITNAALLHVVGREEGDLPINNLIYTNLLHKCSIISPEGGEDETFAALTDRYSRLAGAVTLDHHPHPSTSAAGVAVSSSGHIQTEAEQHLAAADAEELERLRSETFSCDADRRRAFSAFVAAVQSDMRIKDVDVARLPDHHLCLTDCVSSSSSTATMPSPAGTGGGGGGSGGVSLAAANAENTAELANGFSSADPPPPQAKTFYFWPYKCDYRSSVAYESTHFVVMVNLKPVTRGHLMVVPKRIMPTIHSLSHDEVVEWGFIVKHCCLVLRAVYPEGQGISLAIQQGKTAGQTVPHVHTHVIMYREAGELDGEPEPEEAEQLRRRPRAAEEMQEEADSLRKVFIALEDIVGAEGVPFHSIPAFKQ